MNVKELIMLAFEVSILCTVLGFGLKTSIDDLLYLIRKPSLLLRSLLAIVVIMPLIAIAFARTFDLQPTVKIALIALAISPIPPLLPKRVIKAGGNLSYELGLMALLAVLAIILVPLSVEFVGAVFSYPLE